MVTNTDTAFLIHQMPSIHTSIDMVSLFTLTRIDMERSTLTRKVNNLVKDLAAIAEASP